MSAPSDLPLVLTTEAVVGRTDPGSCLHAQLDHLLDAGVDWLSLPADLRSAYALRYYIGNVRNGGHSQFIGNARNHYGVGPLALLQGAVQAAGRYGLTQTRVVIGQVTEWVQANPEAALRQTGFTGGRAPELDPLDTALYAADLLDEAAWMAELQAFGAEAAGNLARQMGLAKGYVTFPRSPSHLRETRFLMAREPRLEVPETEREAAVARLVQDHPALAQSARAHHLSLLQRERLPTAASCAVLQVMLTQGQWDGRAHDARLAPVNVGVAAGPDRGVFVLIDEPRAYVTAVIADDDITLFTCTGEPHAGLSLSIPTPAAQKGVLSRVVGLLGWGKPKVHPVVRSFDALQEQRKLRLADRIGATTMRTGEGIAETLQALGIAEALARHVVSSGALAVDSWRLLRHEGERPAQDWLFGTEDRRLLEVLATPQSVTVRERTS